MKKVFQLLELDHATEGDYGVEIEAEGRGMRVVANDLWHTENDGSLRGHYPDSAAEFVLNAPIALEKVKPAIQDLLNNLPGAEFDFSFRTSVHVHMNAQQLTYVQLLNVIYLYLLLEEPLTTYCGKERKGNRFCLRLSDAEGVLETVTRLFSGEGRELHNIPHDEIRYSAINLEALRKYGSLEFRSMRGNADPEVIDTWVRALDAIKQYAIACDNPMQIYQAFRDSSPSEFLKSVLGGVAHAFIYPRLIRDIQRSYSLSIDLPHKYVEGERIRAELKKRPAPAKPKAMKFMFGGAVPQPFNVDNFIVDDVVPGNDRVRELMQRALEAQQERQRNEDW